MPGGVNPDTTRERPGSQIERGPPSYTKFCQRTLDHGSVCGLPTDHRGICMTQEEWLYRYDPFFPIFDAVPCSNPSCRFLRGHAGRCE